MKKLFIIANWKSNKTEVEAKNWLQQFTIYNLSRGARSTGQFTNKEIVVCPPFTQLSILKSLIINHKSNIKLGTQDISPFDAGSYTGEVNGEQIKEFTDYAIIGHSERRKYFRETDELINKKIEMAEKYGLTPIICVSDQSQISNLKSQIHSLNLKTLIVAYEPLFAIGSGNPDTPNSANEVAGEIKKEINVPVLYGGSVNSQNVNSFTQMENIDGVLVGKSSLDPEEFFKIIENA